MPVNILNLPALNVVGFLETATEYHVRATPKAISRLFPSCGPVGKVVIHQQKTLFVRDLPSHGRRVAIHLDVPRLKCHGCVRTFTAVVPEVDADRQMTERLVKWIGRQSLEYPFTEIAKQVGIDEKTVRAIFGEYVAELEKQHQRETPVILGLDEIYLSRPRGVITNIGDRCLVDMLENRYQKTIVEFLKVRFRRPPATDFLQPHELSSRRSASRASTLSGCVSQAHMRRAPPAAMKM